jgi:hypothetical protein
VLLGFLGVGRVAKERPDEGFVGLIGLETVAVVLDFVLVAQGLCGGVEVGHGEGVGDFLLV